MPAASSTRHDSEATRSTASRWTITTTLTVVPLMCVSFIVSWTMEWQLLDLRVLHQSNVWFQADPYLFMRDQIDIAQASVRHPNSGFIFGAPLALAEWMLRLAGAWTGSLSGMHLWLVLSIAPTVACLRTLAMFGALRLLVPRSGLAALLCLLDICAFQTVALGSLPESYGASAACIAGCYWMMMETAHHRGPLRLWRWVLMGAAAIGVTVTNALPFAVLFGAALTARRMSFHSIAMRVIGAVVLAFGLNVTLAATRVALSGRDLRTQMDLGTTTDYLHRPAAPIAADVTWAMLHTFLAPRPHIEPGREDRALNPDYGFEIKYVPTREREMDSWWRAVLSGAMLVLGVVGFLLRPDQRPILAGALLVVGGYFALHLLWGRDYFLYGLHWTASLVWLLAGFHFLPRRFRRLAFMVLAAFTGLTALNSAILARDLVRLLFMS